ncbi:hypothetical protein [Sphingobacterium sp. LRF_L2]|uniref:hypothetical protein n=1 Tax=Sphingobacterium sp. LRF_L2 TaxID=3369421 RepID=UPI003F60B6D2
MKKNKYTGKGHAFLYLCLLFVSVSSCATNTPVPSAPPSVDTTEVPGKELFVETPQLKRIKGNSIQIDPEMLYQQQISPETLVADLRMANIKSVHFFIVGNWDGSKNDDLLKPAYLNALKNENIAIWIMLLGNCIYGASNLPADWQMEFLKPYPNQGIKFYSFHRPEFVDWQVSRVKRILQNYKVDGIEFAESYFPEWKTLNGNGFYGDVSLFARKMFTEKYIGGTAATVSFDYIMKNPTVYNKWMDFRADALLSFNEKIKIAIKEEDPDVLYAIWGMGVRKGTIAEIREHYGLDMPALAKYVQPDVIVLQTSAQDWLDPQLAWDYLLEYAPLAKAVQEANPKVALSIQADIVSLGYGNPTVEKRNPAWWLRFFDLSLKSGYYTNTAYEYAFSKKEDIWPKKSAVDAKALKIYKEASLQSLVVAEAAVPLAIINEQDAHWKLVYTAHGLGWAYFN